MKNDTENSVFPSFSSLLCSFENDDIQPQMTNPDISFPFVHLPTPAYIEWNAPENMGSFELHSSINIPSVPYNAAAAIKPFSIDENFVSQKRVSSVSVLETQSVSIHDVATMEQNVNKRPLKVGDTFHNSAGKRKKTMCSEDLCHHRRPESDKPSMTHDRKMEPLRRSQKLGDKITALQKLVCPYGKTDTASVLHEAYVHIKLLQEQVQMLSAPYFRASLNFTQELGAQKEDLRSRGLCLIPLLLTQNLNTAKMTEPSVPTKREKERLNLLYKGDE